MQVAGHGDMSGIEQVQNPSEENLKNELLKLYRQMQAPPGQAWIRVYIESEKSCLEREKVRRENLIESARLRGDILEMELEEKALARTNASHTYVDNLLKFIRGQVI